MPTVYRQRGRNRHHTGATFPQPNVTFRKIPWNPKEFSHFSNKKALPNQESLSPLLFLLLIDAVKAVQNQPVIHGVDQICVIGDETG